jgi:beta-mannanase
MLKKIVKYWKKIVVLFFVVVMFSSPILWKYRYHIKSLLDIRISNTIEIEKDTKLLAVFSFKDLDQSQLIEKSIHYKIKLVKSSGIPITKNEIKEINNPSIPLIFTIETWGVNGYFSFKNDEMKSLYKGKYDKLIQEFCVSVIGDRPNVYFRLNPEIEVPSVTFPWRGRLLSYHKAFEHLSNLTNSFAPQVKQIFGGVGYPGVLDFYPDNKEVDLVSVVLSPESEKSLNYYPKYNSEYYDLFRRLHRFRFLDKPIFVFGSSEVDRLSINQALFDSIKNQVYLKEEIIYSSDNFITSKNKIKKPFHDSVFEFGLYDPNDLLNNEKSVSVEHLFVDFSSLYNGSFEKSFKEVLSRNHNIIVTFEPFRNPFGEDDINVLKNVIKQVYDKEIEQLYSIISQTSNIVYLRFGHEMEIPTTRYPWQSQDPIIYINSFRYFMLYKDSIPSNIKRVWGPAGDRGSDEFWPGSDVVDVISFAIYGLPDKNITDPNKQLSFATFFNKKKRRMRFLDKPIFITEFGVKGPEGYQKKWLEGAAKILKNEPQVIGANYFNMSDTPKAWGEIKPPDWSISKETLDHFINTLNEE